MQQTETPDLRMGITHRSILKMTIPIALAMFVPQINMVTNNIFLGGLGEQQLATAGITGVYYLIFAVAGYGLNSTLQMLLSRRAGENDINGISPIFWNGIRFALLLSTVGIVLTYFITPWILGFSLHSPDILQQAIDFLSIRIWGLPFLYMYQMGNALLISASQTRLLVIGTIAETVTNIALDYALIYGHWGLPALGFEGAAYASLAAEAIGMLVLYSVIRWKDLHQTLRLTAQYAFQPALFRQIMITAAPLIIQYTVSVFTWEVFYIFIEHHGERALAISNAMRNIFGIFGVFTWAFASATTAMVSNIIGQGESDKVWVLVKKIVTWSTGIAVLAGISLNIAPALFLSIYGQSPEFISEAIPVVRILSIALVQMSFSNIYLSAVSGTGKTRVNLLIELAAICVYLVYVWVVLEVLFLPIAWGWASEWLYWSISFALAYWYLRSERWKEA